MVSIQFGSVWKPDELVQNTRFTVGAERRILGSGGAAVAGQDTPSREAVSVPARRWAQALFIVACCNGRPRAYLKRYGGLTESTMR